MAVTIQDIKSLQDRTGAGLMDCKKALVQADGDIERAIDILREKGIAKAASKAGRTAAEGLAVVKVCEKCGKAVILEINCETDFVSGSPKFREFVDQVTELVFEQEPADVEEARELTKDLFNDAFVAFRENFKFRRYALLKSEPGQAFGTYVHMKGKIAALVLLSKDAGDVNRGLAMTVCSADPYYKTLNDVPAEDRARETAIAEKEVADDPKLQSKPENVRAMIVERKVASRLGENCLDQKVYALDPEGKKLVSEVTKENGVEVLRFVRYMVGEGVEKSAEE